MHKKYPHLFEPLHLRGLTLKNRIFSAPTSLAELGEDGSYSDENIAYYKMRAASGVAMVCVGDVIVDLKSGCSHPAQAGITEPGVRTQFEQLAAAIHAGGAAAAVELDHGGALSLSEKLEDNKIYGPSAYVDDWGQEIHEMSEEQILFVADKFAEAAANAKAFGFDLVMLHAGHGWLIHQFISPLTNKRTDKWGGSLENRLRFLSLVVDKIREAVGSNYPIEVRISGSERTNGGYDLDTGIQIAKILDGKVDLIHVSAGTQQVPYSAVLMHPGSFESDMENLNLAEEIKKHVKTPVVTVGAFNFGWQMEETLAAGKADAIALGRALLADNELVKKIRVGWEDEIVPCLRCSECLGGMIRDGKISCAVNPLIGREHQIFDPIPTNVRKKVLVVGGGPGGMQAAIEAAGRGHQVILCEKNDYLGGALKHAYNGEAFKETIRRYWDSRVRQLTALPIEIRLNTCVDEALVAEIQPDAMIIAVGADPFILPIPGATGKNVVIGAEMGPDTPIGDRVVIIGGGFIGCEEAVRLARQGKDVTVVEMRGELAEETNLMYRLSLLYQVEKAHVKSALGLKCTKITEEGVYAVNEDKAEHFFPADTVIMSAGMRPREQQVEALRALCKESYVIGNCAKAGTIGNATRMGHDAAVALGL